MGPKTACKMKSLRARGSLESHPLTQYGITWRRAQADFNQVISAEAQNRKKPASSLGRAIPEPREGRLSGRQTALIWESKIPAVGVEEENLFLYLEFVPGGL